MRIFLLLFLSFVCSLLVVAQDAPQQAENVASPTSKVKVEKRVMDAVRLMDKPDIDGSGEDAAWQAVPFYFDGNFTQVAPKNLEPSKNTTQIKMGYTDYALYVLAYMKDPNPGTIARELGLRDNFGTQADRFGIVLDTYNQGQNAFYFAVTAAGVQLDLYITPNNEDVSWDAVWNSEVKITENGWVAELEIPWSALRFANQPEQLWGLNFMRIIRSKNEEAFWSPVDQAVSGLVNQSGTLTGISNIKPPLRLQLFPYVSAIVGHDRATRTTSSNFGGGMDVKWGISESFTLDMALVPDFSQVQSDNLVLNLSPFEVQFDENRPFFTEGTDLFNRKGLFYSRRVGQVFNTFNPALPETSVVTSSPTNAKLLNATKISGRTRKGLGIGFFNALTDAAYLEVRDTLWAPGRESYQLQNREVKIDPLTNFNVMVVDQNLPNNSNVALMNTNVTRFDGGKDANVTALDFRLRDKKNTYQVEGFGALSNIWGNKSPETGRHKSIYGHRYSLSFAKISGNFRYTLSQNVESDQYNINDMGIIRAPNEVSSYLYLGYQVFDPFWIFNQVSTNFNFNYQRLYKPNAYSSFGTNVNTWMQFKNFWGASFGINIDPVETNDYFEPRTLDKGYYFTRLPSHSKFIFIESDGRKRLAASMELWNFKREAWDAYDWGFYFGPRYRISNKVSVNAAINYRNIGRERGFVTRVFEEIEEQRVLKEIVFGNRDIQVVEPSARVNITFNNKMGLNIRLRYYWSRVRYEDEFLTLLSDGQTAPSAFISDQDGNGLNDQNVNFNSFNVDLFYSWQIAPGSFLQFAWKDAAYDSSNDARPNFSENLDRFMGRPHSHTFSLKLTYFLEYLMVQNMLKK